MSCLRPLLPLTLLALAVLAGCGGGGDDGTAAGSSSGSSTDTTTGPTTGSGSTSIPDCGYAGFQAELLQRINAVRASGATCGGVAYPPVAALTWNARLTTAAGLHSADMANRNYFDHNSPEGTTLGQRITAAGYAWSTAAENIAAGYGSVDAVMNGWIASAGHCRNLMNANLREVGVACVVAPASATYGNYWTMDLAAPR